MPSSHTLFAIRPYPQAVCHQVALSDPSLHLAPNPHPNTALLHHQKSRIPDLSKKPNKASFSLSPSPVATDGKCPRATLDTTNFSHKRVKQIPESLALLRLADRKACLCYKGSLALVLTPRAKHRPRLVPFHRLSSICKTIRLFGSRWIWIKKNWQVGIEIAVGRRLVIQAGALLINAVFCNRKIRWKVGRDKVVSGCGLSEMSLDNDKWDHMAITL